MECFLFANEIKSGICNLHFLWVNFFFVQLFIPLSRFSSLYFGLAPFCLGWHTE